MRLKDLLKDVEVLESYGNMDIDILGVTYDSRRVKKNTMFICITGFKTDGHRFIQSAIDNGANTIVIEKDMEDVKDLIDKHNISVVRVKNSRIEMAKLASNFYGHPSQKFKVVGITGTNGKTSITYLLSSILKANNKKTSLIGTLKSQIIDKEYKVANTTPESVELQFLFNEMAKADVDVCSMEVSSHSLELKRVDGVDFNIGVFTNLTADHLGFHGDMENYKSAKIKLFYKTTDLNIINIDDKYGKEIYEEIKKLNTPVISYGIDSNSDIYAEDIEMNPTGATFKLITPKFSGAISINMTGLFSIYNVLAAISVCYSMGYSYEEILKGTKALEPIKGRFEVVENDKGIGVIVDYAHTPDALKNVLGTIKDFAKGKVIVVFGCGGDRDSTKRPVMGKIAYDMSDYAIITNDNPRSEDPQKIVDDILKGLEQDENKYHVKIDRREAIKTAVEMAKKDDVILIAGKGHETYQIIGDKVSDFDDKKVALEFLEE